MSVLEELYLSNNTEIHVIMSIPATPTGPQLMAPKSDFALISDLKILF
jgi:hypothetical protein